MDTDHIPTACTLDQDAARAQTDEWQTLLTTALRREQTTDGLSIAFPIAHAGLVEDLAEREAACCAFLSITTRRTDDQITVEVDAADAAGRKVLELFDPSS